ncbi:MAG: VacJ family lipoprotein [Holosporales bacterium]
MSMELRTKQWVVGLTASLFLCSSALATNEQKLDNAASPQQEAASDEVSINDPAEDFNRAMFAFNRVVDHVVTKPVAEIYRGVLPQPVRNRVHCFLNNLGSPLVLVHDILQLKLDQAGETLARFVINSTIGILGLFDAADEFFDIKYHKETMGSTLAHWGVGGDPFLVLPLIGPTNPRDFAGQVVDMFADPFNIWANHEDKTTLLYGRAVLEIVDRRAQLSSVFNRIDRAHDPYMMMRTLYTQNRLYNETDGEQDTDSPRPTE